MERFGKVFREYGGVEETDKVLYFLRWCDDDLREIIDDWDDGKKDTWAHFEAAVKERWQWNDSRKNDSTKEFDRAIEGTYGPDTQSVYNYLEKVDVTDMLIGGTPGRGTPRASH